MASRRTRSNYSSPLRRDMTEEKDEKIVPNLPKSVEFLSMMTSIASHVVKALLDLGHSVRTTVRDSSDEEKVRFLWELKGAKERLKIFEADLTVEGSFDEAIKGVDGVFHIASRVTLCVDSNDLEKLVDRDINGTRNLMNSCEKSRNTVKRIVLTSSSTAVRYRYDATEASPLNESHYSDLDYSKSFKALSGQVCTHLCFNTSSNCSNLKRKASAFKRLPEPTANTLENLQEQLHSDFERRKRIHRNRNSEITLDGRGEKLQRKQRPRVTIGWPSYLERKRREAQEIQVNDQQNLEEQKRIDTD
uniref:NAD-dependent epimerase/dehydratase domain-containing protein n=1 Tax=Brassica campestris TaxID=3711 RepID=M4DBA9_BRACM